jgi:peptide/nickel transport system substrate-binding protein
VQAVAQMLSRVGIVSKVETAPMAPYSSRASKQEFSFHMVGWGASTGEASSPLRSLLATYDRRRASGAVNWGRYSNPKVDYLIEQALQQVDDENRRIMLQRATELAMQDLGIMPIHFQFTIWATKKKRAYTPRTDEYTLAFQFKPAKGCAEVTRRAPRGGGAGTRRKRGRRSRPRTARTRPPRRCAQCRGS